MRYYYRLDVELSGRSYSGAVQSFTTLAPAPAATTGAVTALTSGRATVAGEVTPSGLATTYHFEYGTSTAYGQSSAVLPAGAGFGPVPVSATLTGLRARTRYHYRLVASSPGGTTVGADHTFTTMAPPAPAPRFAFSVVRGQSLSHALGRRLLVNFSCSRACTAHFVIVAVLPGKIRATATPVSLASGTARLSTGRRSGRASLHFTSSARRMLSRAASTRLLIEGYAVGAGEPECSEVGRAGASALRRRWARGVRAAEGQSEDEEAALADDSVFVLLDESELDESELDLDDWSFLALLSLLPSPAASFISRERFRVP